MIKKLLCLLLFLPAISFAAVTASIDRNMISSDETFTLSIVSDKVNPQLSPDLNPLHTDFEVIGSSNSSSISIINGKQTAQQQVMITLMPRHTGRLMIPALTVGKERSQVLYITVKPAIAVPENKKDLFIETSLTPNQVYAQQQAIYSVKFFYRLNGLSGSLSMPQVDNVRFEPLGQEINYQTTRANRAYGVVERRYAVFADKPGTYAIPAVNFTGSAASHVSSNTLFNLTGGRPVRAEGTSVNLTVASIPAHQGDWLPAQQLTLVEQWSPNPPQFTVGTPVTRTIILTAKGLPANQLPNITSPTITGINSYPDQPVTQTLQDSNTLIGQKTFKIAYIPTQAGNFILPAISIQWWNTNSKKFETAKLAAQQFTINAGNSSAAAPSAMPTTPAQITVTSPDTTSHYNIWAWVAGALFIVWVITAYFLWQRKTKVQGDTTDVKKLRDNVKQACSTNDATQIKSALLRWAQQRWPHAHIHTLGEIAKQAINHDFKTVMHELDAKLYRQQDHHIDGAKIWQAFLKNEQTKTPPVKHKIPPLPPLNP